MNSNFGDFTSVTSLSGSDSLVGYRTPTANGELRTSLNSLRAFNNDWFLVTENYSGIAGDKLLANTSGGSFTITLPSSPQNGDYIQVNDAKKTWPTNNIIIDRNGSRIESLQENLTGNISATLGLTYVDTGVGWKVDFASQLGGTATDTIGISMDGMGSTITNGVKGYIQVPYSCSINSWKILADQTGTLVIDLWKNSYSNYPPTSGDSMPGSLNRPTLSNAIKAESVTLTGWTTSSISSNDVLTFNVSSGSAVQRATFQIFVTRT